MSLQSALSTYVDNIGNLIKGYHDIMDECATHNVTLQGEPIADWASIIGTALAGGGAPTLITKTITINNTYNAADDNADGYSSVTVNVPSSASLGTKNIRDNGTYNASGDSLDGYSSVTVNVPATGGRIIGEPHFAYYVVTNWIASTSYIIGDVVIYDTDTYYCIENNDDAEFTAAHWLKIID